MELNNRRTMEKKLKEALDEYLSAKADQEKAMCRYDKALLKLAKALCEAGVNLLHLRLKITTDCVSTINK